VEGERKTSDLFILLLWKLLKDYRSATCIHVVLDNYKIHDSRRTRIALAALGNRVKCDSPPLSDSGGAGNYAAVAGA
jgi:hypothetical protein